MTSQVAATGEPFTVATNFCVVPAAIAAAEGVTKTPCAAVTLSVAVPVSPELPEVVAVTVTVAGLAGAVKSPAAVMLPPPLTLHVKVEPGALAAKAVN